MYESFKNFYERPCYCTNWPDSFDFETDEICQTIFKPFIEKQLEELKTYDAQRPKDITYIFHEHAKRVANDIKSTCLHMNLTNNVANNMYWALLPHDIGKKNLPLAIWDTKDQPNGDMKAQRRTHTIVGAQFAEERFKDINHPFKTLMIDIMLHHHEQMNGAGTLGIPARKLSNPVRLAAIVEAYDGWRIWRPHFGDRNISNTGVLNRMREEKAAAFFDMRLFESFADMKMEEYKQKQEA